MNDMANILNPEINNIASNIKISQLEGYNSEWKKDYNNSPNFKKYVDNLLDITTNPPILVSEMERSFSKNVNPSYIYRAGKPLAGNQVYIHIFTESATKKIKYKAIEPRLENNRNKIMDIVDKNISLMINEDDVFSSIDKKTDYLFKILDSIIKIGSKNEIPGSSDAGTWFFNRSNKLILDEKTYSELKYEVYCEKIGSSLLEPVIRDPYIEDIHCAGVGPIHVDHKIYGSIETSLKISNNEDLNNFVLNLSEIVGRPASHRDPIIDAKMPDGSRLNLVFGEDISTRGSNFTIRKFSAEPLSITQLINWGTMNSLIAAYIWILLEEKMSIWICGETASGKTTTLSAITAFIPDTYKIVSIEEVPEVYAPHSNWVREVVRDSSNATSEEKGAVSMFQLLKAALRQRPNYIIVGEVRGQEGMIAFQAMQTGHASMATFHAADIAKLVQRMTNDPINVPKTHIDNLNAAIFQSAVNDPETGRYKRRVLAVNEILGYEPAEELFNFVETFSFNAEHDSFTFRGRGTSYLLDAKIAVMRGYGDLEISRIYDDLFDRAEILEYMIVLGVFDYPDVLENIRWVEKVGVEQGLGKLKRMALMELGSDLEEEISRKVGRFNDF